MPRRAVGTLFMAFLVVFFALGQFSESPTAGAADVIGADFTGIAVEEKPAIAPILIRRIQ
jgi:hypothetical protein